MRIQQVSYTEGKKVVCMCSPKQPVCRGDECPRFEDCPHSKECGAIPQKADINETGTVIITVHNSNSKNAPTSRALDAVLNQMQNRRQAIENYRN